MKKKQVDLFKGFSEDTEDIFANIPPFVMPKNPVYEKYPEEYKLNPKKLGTDTNGTTKAIIQYLQLHGIQVSRINVEGQFHKVGDYFAHGKKYIFGFWAKSGSTKGVPDLIFCINGIFFGVDIKTGKDKQSPEQIEWQKNHEKNGGIYYLAKDFDVFKEFIDPYLQNKN